MSNKMLARKLLTPTTLRAGGGGRSHVRGYSDTTRALLRASPSRRYIASLALKTRLTIQSHLKIKVDFLLFVACVACLVPRGTYKTKK